MLGDADRLTTANPAAQHMRPLYPSWLTHLHETDCDAHSVPAGPNPNCYLECICAAGKHAHDSARAEWISTFKTSEFNGFTTQLVACVTRAAEHMSPTLPQHVHDHLKQTNCTPSKCPK